MKKIILGFFVFLMLLFTCSTSFAFWVWTPKDKKITDPSKVVKDTPAKQYEFAMSLFKAEQYKDAGDEFVRLVENWKDSKFTPDAQYYAAVSYQKAGKHYIAFKNYEKVIKFYPYFKNVKDIVKAEYEIGEYYYNTSEAKLMGVELMGDAERAVEIFSAIITNMPYSEYADKAQFMIGQSYKKLQKYNEAALAFKKLVQEYPKSKLVDKAKYEVAECMSLYSKGSDYDQASTDEAIDEFKRYAEEIKDVKVQEKAEKTLNLLREKKAKSIYDIAAFYHKGKKYRAAYIYYSQVINEYRDTTYYKLSEDKLTMIQPI
ncbi:MAG: outer membrane protein assembly factor BamD [Candidatus Omnitrophica bacterium]|nr:outer membrane protein assembly factor BamD [Candidatus Omnitrophota bacterium]